MMNKVVLDASALLALLHRELGGEQVAVHIEQSVICAVNVEPKVAGDDDKRAIIGVNGCQNRKE